MANLGANPTMTPQTLFSSSATAYHALGEKMVTPDGRTFRYARAGAVDLVAGNMIQAAAQIANHLNMTPSAAAIGATTVTMTPGATGGAENLYAGGYLMASTAPGNGIAYRIKSHPAITASTAFTVTLDEPIQIALTSSSRIDLQTNPFKNVIQTPVTTLTGACVGNAPFVIVATEYGWIQTHGVASALVAGTPGVGLAVVVPGTAAGAVVIDGAASATKVVGVMMSTGVDGKNNAVFLDLE